MSVVFAIIASNSYPEGISAFEPQGKGKHVKQKITTDNGVLFLPVMLTFVPVSITDSPLASLIWLTYIPNLA